MYLCVIKQYVRPTLNCKIMMTNNYSREQRYAIANEIWRQLGSQRFSLMTGCKPIVYGENDGKVFLLMSVGRNAHSVNRFEVSYNEGTDLYEVRFMRKYGDTTKVVAKYTDVYCDMLCSLFEQHTGMTTAMPRIVFNNVRVSA